MFQKKKKLLTGQIYNLNLRKIADASECLASRAAEELSVPLYTSDWKELVQDSSIDVINITAVPVALIIMDLFMIMDGITFFKVAKILDQWKV